MAHVNVKDTEGGIDNRRKPIYEDVSYATEESENGNQEYIGTKIIELRGDITLFDGLFMI